MVLKIGCNCLLEFIFLFSPRLSLINIDKSQIDIKNKITRLNLHSNLEEWLERKNQLRSLKTYELKK